MNVDLAKNFPLDHSTEDAWGLLKNIEAVANCMPGAEITEVVDENNFKGKVRVSLGPVRMEFNGDITVQSVEADKNQIHLIAQGKDKKGTSSVTMDLTANVESGTESESALLGDAKVIVNGKLATFGQRMMAQVSDQILDQFADNFREELSANANNTATDSNESGDAVAEASATSSSSETSSASPSKKTGNEINGFKFIFSTITGVIAGLFKRK